MRSLVVYFSATGSTKAVAELVAKNSNSDLYEIVPKDLYTSQDLNWNDKGSRSSVEMRDVLTRPEIASKVNVEPYDIVYIGFPIWWYTAPRIINSFVESNDLINKRIILFATSGGSSIDSCISEYRKLYPMLSIVGGSVLPNSSQVVARWIKSMI